MYLTARGNARGRLNFTMPLIAAATANFMWGPTKVRNRASGELVTAEEVRRRKPVADFVSMRLPARSNPMWFLRTYGHSARFVLTDSPCKWGNFPFALRAYDGYRTGTEPYGNFAYK